MSAPTEAARPARDLGPALASILALVVVPALFLYGGLFQRYPLPGWVDPGIYLGYFFDLQGLAERYGFGVTTYHGTRLSWVLPGFWLHQALPALEAQQALIALLYFPTIWATWIAGRGLAGSAGGYVASAFLAYNPLFIAAVTFGAVDGATVAYLMGAAACLFATGPGGVTRLRAAGFAALSTLAAAAQPFAAPLALALVAGYLLASRHVMREMPPLALAAVVGALACFLLLASLGKIYGFPFWFPAESAGMAQRAVTGFGRNYRLPVAEWLYGSYRLLVPCLLAGGLLIALTWAKSAVERRITTGGLVVLALSWILFVVFDVGVGGLTLQVRNYTNLALPACAIALAVLVRHADLESIDARRVLLLTTVLATPAVLVALSYAVDPGWLAKPSRHRKLFLVLVLAGAAVLWSVWRTGGTSGRWLAWLGLLLAACSAFNQDSANAYVARTGARLDMAYTGADALAREIKADRTLAGRQLLFWYQRAAFTTGDPVADRQLEFKLRFGEERYQFTYYDTLSSLYLFDRSLLGSDFPRIEDAPYWSWLTRADQPPAIILLSQRTGDLAVAIATLESRGWQVMVRRQHRFDLPQFGFSAWILDACSRSVPEASWQAACQ